MICNYRRFLGAGLLAGASAVTLALVAAWGAPPPDEAARVQTRPAAPVAPAPTPEATSASQPPLVKASEKPNLLLLFTDQVEGYIQPCG